MEQLQSNSSSSSSFNYPFQHWADLVSSETFTTITTTTTTTASQNSSSALLNSVLYIANPLEVVNLWHLLRSDLPLLAILSTHLVTFLVGVTGNLAVIVSWTAKGGDGGSRGRDQSQRCSARHQLHQPTTTFMMSLAVADLLRLTLFLPLETAEYFVTRWDRLGLVCRLSTFVEMFSCAASVLNLVAVSVERFLVIVQPMRARNWCTVCKSRRTVAVIWTLALLIALPPVFNKRLKKVTYFTGEIGVTAYHCFEMEGQWAVFCAFYELFLLLVLPALLMTFCYFRVILKLKSSTRQMGNGGILSEKCKNEKSQDFLIRPSSSNNNIQWWRCKVRKNGGKQKKLTKNMAVKTSRKNSNGCFFSRFQSTIRLPCRSFLCHLFCCCLLIRKSMSRNTFTTSTITTTSSSSDSVFTSYVQKRTHNSSKNIHTSVRSYEKENSFLKRKAVQSFSVTADSNSTEVPVLKKPILIKLTPLVNINSNKLIFCNDKLSHKILPEKPFLSSFKKSSPQMFKVPTTAEIVHKTRKQLYCQVIKMLLLIVVLFYLCWGPRLIFNVIRTTGVSTISQFTYNVRVFFYLLSFVHSALNPFVYSMCFVNFM